MSVIKSKRKTSKFEVLVNASRMRDLAIKYSLNDFGVENTDELSENDVDYLIFAKNKLRDSMFRIVEYVTKANDIYMKEYAEYCERRKLQDLTIGECHNALQVLQCVINVMHTVKKDVNINKYDQIVDMVGSEIALVKAWRTSDNLVGERLKKEYYDKTAQSLLVYLTKIIKACGGQLNVDGVEESMNTENAKSNKTDKKSK